MGTYEGWYNVREETFVTETDAAASDYLDPVSGKPLKKVQESSYLFKMSKYHAAIEEHIRSHPEFLQPESRRNEILDRLKVPPAGHTACGVKTPQNADSRALSC